MISTASDGELVVLTVNGIENVTRALSETAAPLEAAMLGRGRALPPWRPARSRY